MTLDERLVCVSTSKMKNYTSFRIDDILLDSEKSEKSGQTSSDASSPGRKEEDSPAREETGISGKALETPTFWPSQEGSKPFSSFLPYYSVDQALRLSQSRILKHYPTSSQLFSYPFQRELDYAVPYQALGQYQIPLGIRDYPSQVNYPMFGLSRPTYTSTCKRKGGQIRFNNSQTGQLEKAFVQQKYLNANDRKKLAQSLGLTDRQVKTWFQNRRAKLRKSKGQSSETEMHGSPHNNNNWRYPESPMSSSNDMTLTD